MREFSVPATAAVAPEENLTDMVWANAERFGNAVSFRRQVDGTWVDITARDFAVNVLRVQFNGLGRKCGLLLFHSMLLFQPWWLRVRRNLVADLKILSWAIQRLKAPIIHDRLCGVKSR